MELPATQTPSEARRALGSVAVIVATCGDKAWQQLALDRAVPSARAALGPDDGLVVQHAERFAIHESRNMAAARAQARWLCFLDADDELGPGYLDQMADAGCTDPSCPCQDGDSCHYQPIPVEDVRAHGLADSAADAWPRLLVPSIEYVKDDGTTERRTPDELAAGLPFTVQNRACIGTLVPRDLFLAVGGFREWPCFEDWDLWLRCVAAGATLTDVPDATYRAWRTSGSRNEPPRSVKTRTWARIRAANGINRRPRSDPASEARV